MACDVVPSAPRAFSQSDGLVQQIPAQANAHQLDVYPAKLVSLEGGDLLELLCALLRLGLGCCLCKLCSNSLLSRDQRGYGKKRSDNHTCSCGCRRDRIASPADLAFALSKLVESDTEQASHQFGQSVPSSITPLAKVGCQRFVAVAERGGENFWRVAIDKATEDLVPSAYGLKFGDLLIHPPRCCGRWAADHDQGVGR